MIHIVKGFGVVNKAEVDAFLELSCFFNDPTDVRNVISGSCGCPKSSLNIWKFLIDVQLKPSLENFENYFASVWDECNCVVVWTFFDIASDITNWLEVPTEKCVSLGVTVPTCPVPGWRHTSEPWTPCPPHHPHSLSSPEEMEMRHAIPHLSVPDYTQPSARLLHPFPILMWSTVMCFGSQSPRTDSFIWRAGPAPQKRQELCTQQSRVCSVYPGDVNTHWVLPSTDEERASLPVWFGRIIS